MINTNDPTLYEPLQRQLVLPLFFSSTLWGSEHEFNPHLPLLYSIPLLLFWFFCKCIPSFSLWSLYFPLSAVEQDLQWRRCTQTPTSVSPNAILVIFKALGIHTKINKQTKTENTLLGILSFFCHISEDFLQIIHGPQHWIQLYVIDDPIRWHLLRCSWHVIDHMVTDWWHQRKWLPV